MVRNGGDSVTISLLFPHPLFPNLRTLFLQIAVTIQMSKKETNYVNFSELEVEIKVKMLHNLMGNLLAYYSVHSTRNNAW